MRPRTSATHVGTNKRDEDLRIMKRESASRCETDSLLVNKAHREASQSVTKTLPVWLAEKIQVIVRRDNFSKIATV